MKILWFSGKYKAEIKISNTEVWNKYDFTIGVDFPQVTESLDCTIDFPNMELDLFRVLISHYIVSERLKTYLESLEGSQLQFQKLNVMNKSSNFYLLNFLEHSKCVDLESSVARIVRGKITSRIKKLVIDYSRVSESPIFLIEESYKPLFCFQTAVAETIVNSGFNGIEFVRPEDYWL